MQGNVWSLKSLETEKTYSGLYWAAWKLISMAASLHMSNNWRAGDFLTQYLCFPVTVPCGNGAAWKLISMSSNWIASGIENCSALLISGVQIALVWPQALGGQAAMVHQSLCFSCPWLSPYLIWVARGMEKNFFPTKKKAMIVAFYVMTCDDLY